MTIKLKPEPEFVWPVKLTVPGKKEPAVLEAVEFRYMPLEERTKFIQECKALPVYEVLAKVVKGWGPRDVQGESGDFLPYSPEALKTVLMNYDTAFGEFWTQWLEAHAESRIKN
ncbi:hypothetical protein P3G55_18745 [Leptospira sp. 96542]|nr:hypothetical protein [Leptospira sp. 96542]